MNARLVVVRAACERGVDGALAELADGGGGRGGAPTAWSPVASPPTVVQFAPRSAWTFATWLAAALNTLSANKSALIALVPPRAKSSSAAR